MDRFDLSIIFRVPIYVISDSQKNGYAFMPLPDGGIIRITIDYLLCKKEEIDKFFQDFDFQDVDIRS